MKIATWNVNSLRVRLPHVLTWLNDVKPDVLALQELKLSDPDFPIAEIQEAGYHSVFSGQRTYNGVAVLSREPANELVKELHDYEDPQRRVLAVTIGDVRIVNLYIPNGESVSSAKYEYKLNWLTKLHLFLESELKKYPKLIVLGDFNIAPEDIDVHDPQLWQDKVLVSSQERQAFKTLLNLGLNDCFRMLNPEEKVYSWWDYRMNAFKRGLGMRIDHIIATENLLKQCQQCYVDKAPRNWERPSDHAPVVAEFKFC